MKNSTNLKKTLKLGKTTISDLSKKELYVVRGGIQTLQTVCTCEPPTDDLLNLLTLDC